MIVSWQRYSLDIREEDISPFELRVTAEITDMRGYMVSTSKLLSKMEIQDAKIDLVEYAKVHCIREAASMIAKSVNEYGDTL